MKKPQVVVGADWSSNDNGRWVSRARLQEGGDYIVEATSKPGNSPTFLAREWEHAGRTGCVLVGFDHPIGIPAGYAARIGVLHFLELLPHLGVAAPWSDFFEPAADQDQITLNRPFYPAAPGGTAHDHLLNALGIHAMADLRRGCETAQPHRPAAGVLFWALGPNAPAKAAIHGWSHVLRPSLVDPNVPLRLWPFDGALVDLVKEGGVVVTEIYPTDSRHQLGLAHDARANQANRVFAGHRLLGIHEQIRFSSAAMAEIEDGFGDQNPQDRFDALCGLLAMLLVILGEGYKGAGPQHNNDIEGWILGLKPEEQL